jgi:hypothetical protein
MAFFRRPLMQRWQRWRLKQLLHDRWGTDLWYIEGAALP